MNRANLTYLFLLFFTLLTACNPKVTPTTYETETTAVGNDYEKDEELVALVTPYKTQIEGEMNRVIGYFAHDMYKDLPESELGNFLCDASISYARNEFKDEKIDFCLMNYGGIRINHVPQGDVFVKTMFDIMPFENELVIVDLTGEAFRKVMDRVARKGGWPISKDVNILIENKQIRDFLIEGEVVDWDKTYRVLIPDYIANGGDGMDMLTDVPKQFLTVKLRDAMIAYCEDLTANNTPITSRINGRIIVAE